VAVEGREELSGDGENPIKNPDTTDLEVMVTTGVVQGKRTQSRLWKVNGVGRRRLEVVGKLAAVLFRPEDLRLMEGSPSRRRTYLDTPLSLTYPQYAQALSKYEEVLRKRNRLLVSIKEGEMPKSVLPYWTQQLLQAGELLQDYRASYLLSATQLEFPLSFSVEYLPSLITPERLAEYADREILSGHTLIGPHKDDFDVKLPLPQFNGEAVSVATYGSRGQQRLAVLWLKQLEHTFLKEKRGVLPVWLLDDIMSELDDDSRGHVLRLMQDSQVILTSTHQDVVKLLNSEGFATQVLII
jgi:DNA replication and repair protein RecF